MPTSRMKRSSKKKHIHKHKQRNTRKQQRHNKHTKKPHQLPPKKLHPHRPPRQLLSKAPPCERILRRVYPTLRVHPLTSSIKEALVQKFKQRIPFSKWGDKTGKQGITYWELFRALSGYNHKKNEHHLVLIKGGFVRDIVQGKSLDEIHDVDVVHTKPFGQARFGNNGLGVLKVKYTPISDAESKYYYMKIGEAPKHGTDYSVDCTHTRLDDFTHYEAPVNMLMLNVSVNTPIEQTMDKAIEQAYTDLHRVYDISGNGFDNAKKQIWDAPDKHTLKDAFWLSNAKLWRMLKFQQRGYTIPLDTKRAIYNWWLSNYHNAPSYNWMNPWGKHFGGNGDKVHQSVLNTRVAVKNVLTMVCADFCTLQMELEASKTFFVMLLEMNLFTVASRLTDLQKMKQYYKKKRYTKEIVHSLSSSVEQISKNNKDIKHLCDVLLFAPALQTHKCLFDYIQLLLRVNLLTTFPIVTFYNYSPHTPPHQSNKSCPFYQPLLYTFPQYKPTENQNTLCYPMTPTAKTTIHNALSAISVHSKSNKKTTTLKKILKHTNQGGTRCFIVGANCKQMMLQSIVTLPTVLQLVWYNPTMDVKKVTDTFDVEGKWVNSRHTLDITPTLQWTFTTSLAKLRTEPVVLDVLNEEWVDWTGESVAQWVSASR